MEYYYHNRLRSSSASSASSASSTCSSRSSISSLSSSDGQDCPGNMLTSCSPTHHHHHHHHHHQHNHAHGGNKVTKNVSPTFQRVTRSRSQQQQQQQQQQQDDGSRTLTRSTGLLNLDEASLGSPGTRKPMLFQSNNTNQQHGTGLKRPLSGQGGDKFTFPKPKPVHQVQQQHGFSSPSANSPSFNSKLRKMSSVDNLFSHHRQLSDDGGFNYLSSPTTTISPTNNTTNNNTPATNDDANNSHNNNNNNAKPKFKFNASLQPNTNDYNTPDNSYKSVKPLQTAFMSTGLLSKRNRINNPGSAGSSRSSVGNDSRGPPETPCKKAFGTPNNSGLLNNTSFPSFSNSKTSGSESSVKSKFGLRDSKLRFSIDFGNNTSSSAQRSNSITSTNHEDEDFDDLMQDGSLPATPTKDNSSQSQQQQQQHQPSPFDMPIAASKQVSEGARTITTASRTSSSNTAKPQTSSPVHSSVPFFSSPQTPDLFNNNNANASFDTSQDAGNNTSDPPRTPAKTPKTPLEHSFGSATSFDSQYADESFEPALMERFDKVSLIGRGEFSMVYSVEQKHSTPGIEPQKYAVKRTKYPYLGPKARSRLFEEVEILRELTAARQNEGHDHVIGLSDAFEQQGHLYITTEFCENGNLDTFVSEQGNISRLDEWRVWKILVELSLGLHHIHSMGFLHLDLKPANVFITFEGTLKIGDFGMATRYPAARGIEREGDREYIAPEVLSCQKYDKPADVFSLGIMMLEIAANIVLPDNGVHWQKLRSGDLSEAGRLSSGDLHAHGHDEDSSEDGDDEDDIMGSPVRRPPTQGHRRSSSNLPFWAPKFMVDNSGALDKIVKWMLDPEPTNRPTVEQILMTPEVSWVEKHRKAGAVIYEGDYGPEPNPLTNEDDDDEEMHFDDDQWRRSL